jgi:hypothetical protein
MPTSITTEPGRIQAPGTNSGLPIAATRISASPTVASEVACLAVANGDRCGLHEQLKRHRPADDVALAHDDGVLAAHLEAFAFQHQHDPYGVQGRWIGMRCTRPAHVVRVETVDVLRRVDALEHGDRGNVRRQRQLDKNAVDRRVGIEPVDQREQLDLARGRRQVVCEDAMPVSRRRGALLRT